jgi:hypothetical protein
MVFADFCLLVFGGNGGGGGATGGGGKGVSEESVTQTSPMVALHIHCIVYNYARRQFSAGACAMCMTGLPKKKTPRHGAALPLRSIK